jgi:transposase
MNYCGIDLANKTSAICIVDEKDRVLRERSIRTESDDLAEALSGLGRLRVVIEASPLAEWVAGLVEQAGHEAVIIDPRAAKHLVSSKKKTDARDARTLARLSRSGWYTQVHRKSEGARELRSRLQGRQALLKAKGALQSSVRGLLRAHGIRVGEISEGEFSAHVLGLAKERVPGLLGTLEALLGSWDHARRGVLSLEKALNREERKDPVIRRLRTVPGVGPQVSAAFRATIDDPGRFRRGEEVADYVGLAPRVYQSGETEYRGRISKEGDKLLRWLMVEASHVLLTRGQDCALKRWGQRLEAKKGSAKAKVALARKLVILLWRLWRDERDFEAWPQSAPESAAQPA